MKNFVEFLRESEGTGTCIKEEDGGGTPPSNNTMGSGQIATTPTPLSFQKRRFAGKMDEYVVTKEEYAKLKFGRSKGDKWANHGLSEELESFLRNSLYTDGAALVTNSDSGASVILKHLRILQLARNQPPSF